MYEFEILTPHGSTQVIDKYADIYSVVQRIYVDKDDWNEYTVIVIEDGRQIDALNIGDVLAPSFRYK